MNGFIYRSGPGLFLEVGSWSTQLSTGSAALLSRQCNQKFCHRLPDSRQTARPLPLYFFLMTEMSSAGLQPNSW